MDKKQLQKILNDHTLWLRRKGGMRANLCGANLCGANLCGANLRGANLRDADLWHASLRDAGLCGANLCGANLRGADLSGADLWHASLRDAGLRGADLSGADLLGASLCDADLWHANLLGADLSGADLGGADLRGAKLPDGVPTVPDIDRAILAAIGDGGLLDMRDWHTCDTTHCRAGWAVHLAGDAGYALEKKVGPSVAGALIYAASRPDMPVPDFYCTDEEALADMRECAGVS